MMNKEKHALKVAVVTVLTAVVVVFTLVIRIPTTKGYLNLCDVAICFIAFTFGPISAFLAAGLGTAIADLISGYAQWAPISFVVHGIEGLLIALIVRKQPLSKMRILLAAIGCILTVSLGYFVLSALFISTVAVAAAEIPPNMIQAGVGAVFGFALSKAIKRAYPPVSALSW